MRSLGILLGLGVLALPSLAAAGPLQVRALSGAKSESDHPLLRLIEAERSPELLVKAALEAGVFGDVPLPSSNLSTLDSVHAKHDIRLDPQSGATTGQLDLVVRANGGPLAAIGFTFDQGLASTALTADGRSVSVDSQVMAPARLIQVTFSPPLNAGESTTVHLSYSGTLTCGAYADSVSVVCTKGQDFSYFSHQSIFPYIFDPRSSEDGTLDSLTRDITLRVPAGTDVVVTGEKIGDVSDENGATTVSSWTIDHPLSRTLGLYAFAGKLGMTAIAGRSTPTTLVYPAPEDAIDQRMESWSAGVLDFVETMGGGALPFQKSMTLVRLPSDVGNPGTATFGMTLLSETYARAGDMLHEETWAHENTHLFWGIVVPEANSSLGRLMSEGLATLSEIEYTWGHHYADQDREVYLAQRFTPIGIDLRTAGKDLPAVQLAPGSVPPDAFGTTLYTMWAYEKTSATLDNLRATIGDDVFAAGLQAYVAKCSYVGCTPNDFRQVLETTSGKSLQAYFDRWVDAWSRPQVTVGFRNVDGGVDVNLTKADATALTLELWLRLEDGELLKKRVDLTALATEVHVDTPAAVRSVAANPRHDVLVDSISAIPGDLDFDGETDGFDVIKCSRLVGSIYKATNGLGLWNADDNFDARCDLNGDLRIDDADLALILQDFGKLESLMRVSILAILGFALAACGGGDRAPPPAPIPIGFDAAPTGDGAVVFMRSRSDAKNAILDVVARGVPDFQGAALRITWDPAALTFVEAESGPAWSSQSITIAKEGTPGQLAVAWAEKGSAGIAAPGEVVLGTLTFVPKNGAAASIAFRTDRSALLDAKGATIPVTWSAGTVAALPPKRLN